MVIQVSLKKKFIMVAPVASLMHLDKSGKSLWQADVGLQGSPLLVSDSIFFISDRNELVRLDKNSGNIIWLRKLITKKTPEHFYTPILAGSKLWITGGDSNLRSFDLETGGLQETNLY